MPLSRMLRNVAIRIWLPCQLVWQEAKVDTLDTRRNLRRLPISTCTRRLKRRVQVEIGELGGLRCLACEPYSPTRRARGGQKRCVEQCSSRPDQSFAGAKFSTIFLAARKPSTAAVTIPPA